MTLTTLSDRLYQLELHQLEIVGGPGELDWMIALFRKQPVTFTFSKEQTEQMLPSDVKLLHHDERGFEIQEVNVPYNMRKELIIFQASCPGRLATVFGAFNLKTRKGYMNLHARPTMERMVTVRCFKPKYQHPDSLL